MSKRFTDTEKWEDPWFRNLLKEYQIFWIYILDKCDSAGVWKVDFEMAEFCLKQKCDEKELFAVFKDRVKVFDHGNRWFIPKFISFQYGELDSNCRPHKSVLNILSSYNIEGYLKGINTFKDKTRTRQDNTRQEDLKTIKTKTNGVPPKYCHDCEKYFSEQGFEKHLHLCRKKVSA